MEYDTMPLDPEETTRVLWQRSQHSQALLNKYYELVRRDVQRGHEVDGLRALYHGLLSKYQALRLRIMELEDEVKRLGRRKEAAGLEPAADSD